jgi:hypothetical protein
VERILVHWRRLLLAAALTLAPILPGMAYVEPAPSEHSAHAGVAADDHAHHGSTASEQPSSCDQHDDCRGQCCATCVQCFTATMYAPAAPLRARPVQFATVPTLLDSLLVSFLNRPPSAV